MMQIDLGRFRATFYVEAAEHLQSMEAALLQLESAPQDVELLNTIFRAAHSIKGASTTFGIEHVGRFTHVLENLLERMRDGVIEVTGNLIELLLTSVDVMQGLLANAKDDAPLPSNLEQTLAALQQANSLGDESPGPVVGAAPSPATLPSAPRLSRFRIGFQPSREFFRFGQDPLLLLRELHELGSVTQLQVHGDELPTLDQLVVDICYLAWTIELETSADEQAVHDVFMFLDGNSAYQVTGLLTPPAETQDAALAAELAATAGRATPPATTTAGPVDRETTGTGESESAAQATNSTSFDSAASSSDARSSATDSSNSETNASAPLTGRKGAPVDNRASASNARGGESETVRVDRLRLDELINQIGELVIGASMVEQELLSVAGGRSLESMSALGKIVRDLQEMSLTLRMVPVAATFQKMNRIVRDVAKKLGKQIRFITEGDDTELDKTVVDLISDPLVHMVRNAADHGIELPEERLAAGKPAEGLVKLRAYQQGGNIYLELTDDGRGLNRERILAKALERGLVAPDATLSDAEICQLIFAPGFSTAQEVTDISGRGVGMDVVRRNVESLQGSVSIRSEFGHGSTITVRLPLTLAILDGLLVRLSQEIFVVPLLAVVESMSIPTGEVHQIARVGEVIKLRGEIVPLLSLHQLLNIAPLSADSDQVLVVIVEDQGRRLALRVDELMGQQQVVIKNLETNFQKVPGVAGATILGDGRVSLILDIYGISNLVTRTEVTSPSYEPLVE